MDLDVEDEKYNKVFEPSIQSLREKVQINKYSHFKRIFRFILWTLIRYHIKDKYYFEIESEEVNSNVGYILEDGTDRFTNLIEDRIAQIIDPDRIHELSHLKKGIKKSFNGFTIGCTARILIYDYSKAPSGRTVTDIDSVLLRYNSEELIIEFNETKNMKNCENVAKKDLREKFTNVLNERAKGYRTLNTTGYGAKVKIKYYAQSI